MIYANKSSKDSICSFYYFCAFTLHVGIEEYFRVICPSCNGNSQQGFSFKDTLRGFLHVSKISVSSLKSPDNRCCSTGFIKFFWCVTICSIYFCKVTALPSTYAIFCNRPHSDLNARIYCNISIINKYKPRLSKLFYAVEKCRKLISCYFIFYKHSRVIRPGTLRIIHVPVARFCVHHFCIVRRKEANCRSATNASA